MTAYFNLLEPDALVRAFLRHAPWGFQTLNAPEGTPAFSTRFDLLTTADADLRRRITSLPFYRRWSRALRPNTCFVGTTVSEYALFPRSTTADTLVRAIKETFAGDYAFIIIKDIPADSPLLDADANARSREIAAASEAADFVILQGQALAFVPIDFGSVEAFVSALSASRRKDVRRKMRASASQSIEVATVPCGDDRFRQPNVLDTYYALYLNVFRQSELQFDLLSANFFREVLQNESIGGVVFEYRQGEELLGYNLCFVTEGMLIDKYVGFRYPEARAANLYFLSWFHNLRFAKESGLKCYVAGWTDPEIKAYLGARFTFTRHAVYARNRFLRAMLRTLARRFENDRAWREPRDGASRSP